MKKTNHHVQMGGAGTTDIIYDKFECEYNVEELDNQQLRFPFEGSGNIVKNHSQAGQDLFVLSVLNGKRNGKYLEIGSRRHYYGNNTWLLESEFELDWCWYRCGNLM